MKYDALILLADGSPKVIDATQKFEDQKNGTDTQNATVQDPAATQTPVVTTAPPTTQAPPAGFLGSPMSIVIWIAIIVAYFYFIINGQKKKDKKVKELQSSIKTGDEVYTSAGFYGKVVDVEDNTFVIEFGLNKGVRIPVRKSDVYPAATTSKDIEDAK